MITVQKTHRLIFGDPGEEQSNQKTVFYKNTDLPFIDGEWGLIETACNADDDGACGQHDEGGHTLASVGPTQGVDGDGVGGRLGPAEGQKETGYKQADGFEKRVHGTPVARRDRCCSRVRRVFRFES